jgi:hypothetical protein
MATENIWISGKFTHCLVFVYNEIGGESEKKAAQFFILQARRRLFSEEALQAKSKQSLKNQQKAKSYKRKSHNVA